MSNWKKPGLILIPVLLTALLLFWHPFAELTLQELSPIDAHVHILVGDDPNFFGMLRRLNIQVLNICYVDPHAAEFEDIVDQQSKAIELVKKYHGRIAWCSTFDARNWENADFAQSTMLELRTSFRQGAVGVKLYKNVGMEIRSKDGRFLMPDDAVFNPVFAFIARNNKTLFNHSAEPSAAWQPLNPSSPHYDYYKKHPEWHMALYPDRPSKEMILASRDRMVEHNPQMRIIGCHLGSMEDNLDLIAEHLDRYPNLAIDMAARIPDLMKQSSDRVRSFLIKYQDRILYATDLGFLPRHNSEDSIRRWEETYNRDWKYLSTDEVVVEGHAVQGLNLPEPVLRKLYRENVLRWVPDLQKIFQ